MRATVIEAIAEVLKIRKARFLYLTPDSLVAVSDPRGFGLLNLGN